MSQIYKIKRINQLDVRVQLPYIFSKHMEGRETFGLVCARVA